ncbi:hypothetical protein Tco_0739203 [Tanacetum coccineum]
MWIYKVDLEFFDWSEEADNAPVALALMATSSTDSSNSETQKPKPAGNKRFKGTQDRFGNNTKVESQKFSCDYSTPSREGLFIPSSDFNKEGNPEEALKNQPILIVCDSVDSNIYEYYRAMNNYRSQEAKCSPKFSGKLTPLTPPMLEVATAVRAEQSLHTKELDITPSLHHSDDSSAGKKAESSSPIFLRLKKQNTKQAAQILRLKTKLKILVKKVKPLIAEYNSFVKLKLICDSQMMDVDDTISAEVNRPRRERELPFPGNIPEQKDLEHQPNSDDPKDKVRQDLHNLHRLVIEYYEHIPPTGLGLILNGDLTTMMETTKESDDELWRNQF